MKQKLFTIMIAAVIFLTLVAPVHTVADIALPVDEPVDRYETVNDIGEKSPLTSIADGCSILKYVDVQAQLRYTKKETPRRLIGFGIRTFLVNGIILDQSFTLQ